jgi:hypothetical protein
VEVTEPAYRLFERQHDLYGAANCAFTLGRALRRLADREQASQYLAESERLFRTIGNRTMAARALCVRIGVALDDGDLDAARSDLAQADADLTTTSRTAELPWWLLERGAAYACQRGEIGGAALLLGTALRRWEAAPAPVDPAERALRERTLEALRRVLGAAALEGKLEAGRALETSEVLALVRQAVAADAFAQVDAQ